MRYRRLLHSNRTTRRAQSQSQVGSLESDRDRDIADWQVMRRLVQIYMPLLALAPVLAGAAMYIAR